MSGFRNLGFQGVGFKGLGLRMSALGFAFKL